MNEIYNFDNGSYAVFGNSGTPLSEARDTPAAFLVRSLSPTIGKIQALWQATMRDVKGHYEARQTARILSRLNAATLKDIGLLPEDIQSVAKRAATPNFWQPRI